MSHNLKKIKKALKAHKADVLAARESTAGDRATQELDQTKIGRLSRMDALQAQAMSKALDQRRGTEIIRIDAALERIDKDEYGYCLTCGEPIKLKRLELDPAVAQCAICAS